MPAIHRVGASRTVLSAPSGAISQGNPPKRPHTFRSALVPVVKWRFDVAAATSANTLRAKDGESAGLRQALVMRLRASEWAALIFLFAIFGGPSAEAMGLCDCCSGTALTTDCQSACDIAKEEIPMCRPVVIYDGDTGEPSGNNALAVGSLKHLSMGSPDRPALERFRQWFELWRNRAEAKFQGAPARHNSGEGSDAEFADAEAERDRVLVNYQHGIQRYSEILRTGRHERAVVALAAGQSAKRAVPASVCKKNWVNAPCTIAEVAPAAPRLVRRVVAPRRDVPRKEVGTRQKTARQKINRWPVAEQQVIEQKVVVKAAVRTAKVCTGNWVNAACAAP